MRASLLVVLPVIAVEVAVRGANEQIKCHVPKNTLQIYDLFEYQQRIWEKMWGVPLFSAWPSRTFCKGKEKVLEGLLENKGWLFLNKGALLENNPWLLRKRTQGVPPVFLKITSRLPQDYLKVLIPRKQVDFPLGLHFFPLRVTNFLHSYRNLFS